jgi:hypothetical protein
MRGSFLGPVIAALFLAGCQTDTPTASGSPEVTIRGVRPDQAKPQLVNAILNKGLRIKSDSPYQIVTERQMGGIGGAAVLGALLTSDASDVIERFSFSIAEAGGGTRIVLDRYMVKYPGTGRESAIQNNKSIAADNLQATLDSLTAGIR